MSETSISLTFAQPRFVYSQGDEGAFFAWLKSIAIVESFVGVAPSSLSLRLSRRAGKADLGELVALFFRYGLDVQMLGAIVDPSAVEFFRDPDKFWNCEIDPEVT